MKKTNSILLAIAIVLAVFASACGAQAAPTTVAPAPTQTLARPTTPVEVPTQQVTPSNTPTQAFAPVCQNSASNCAAPDVQDTIAAETYCQKKVPYTNILVDPGTTFEVLDKSGDFSCADSGQKSDDGKTVLTCTGKELFNFDLKLTNPACSRGNLVTGTGQCQEGFGFDSAQGCCAPIADKTTGSVTIKVNLGACPSPQ